LLVVLALVISVLPGLGDVRERFASAEPIWIAAAFLCSLTSRLCYVAALRGTLSRQITWRSSWHLGMAEQGSNVLLPTGGVGGPALGAIVLHRAGVPTGVAAPRSAALFLLTSATSFSAIAIAGFATGVGLLPGDVSWVGTLLPAALALAVIAAVAALVRLPVGTDSPGAGRAARWARQAAALLRDGVKKSIVLLRDHDPLVIGGCIGYLTFDIAALGAAFQAFGGAGPPFGAFVLAYALGQVGSLIPTPGGLGGTEGGLIGMLVVYGAPAAPAAAAVLAYRVFQLGLPAILGLLAFRQIRRRLADADQTAAVAARFDAESP
ncbi:MAG: putative heme transporter, partial [Solirubrobacteraceae bacterium]|nr:putative heme transporter [Solirubrobacteraceae bacterium]